MNAEIRVWRETIDAIDRQLLELLNARARAALQIAHCKRAAGLPVLDRWREDEVLARVRRENRGPLGGPAVTRLFARIIHESRAAEEELLAGTVSAAARGVH